MNLVKVYQIEFVDKPVRIVFPTINDVKLLIKEQEEMLDMLLLNKLKIRTEYVCKGSKIYRTALKNRIIEPIN